MYSPRCYDISQGERDNTLSRVDTFGLEPISIVSIKTVVNMMSDYNWILLALAKYSEGADVSNLVQDNYDSCHKEMLDEIEKIDFEDHFRVVLGVFYGVLVSAYDRFVQLSISNMGLTDNAYHPFGFTYYLGTALKVAHDLYAVLYSSTNGKTIRAKSLISEVIFMILKITEQQYENVLSLRKKIASMDDIPGIDAPMTYTKMLMQDMSMKDFRNSLVNLFHDVIIGDVAVGSNITTLNNLMRKLKSMGGIIAIDDHGNYKDTEPRDISDFKFPTDIDTMFDE
jgi:hypothetical protein